MENRFGIKDLILYALVIGLGIMIFIGMQQDDRQFEKLQQITARVNEQARDIRDLRNMVSEGVPAIRGGDGATTRPVRAANLPVFRGIAEAQLADNYAPGDWVVDAFGGGVAKLTPLLSGDAYASNVQSYVIQTLCDRNENLEWNGLIAESWEIEDHVDAYREYMNAHPAATQPATTQTASADEPPAPVIITFKLRKNVRFSDGEPLTADDVVFTFDLIMNAQVDAPRHRAYFSKIRRVEKLDDHTVRFVFNDPYFQAFELAAGFDVLPKHFYSKFSVEEFNRSVGYLMGSGPYRMEDPQTWKPGMPIRLVRNDRYWGAQPAFDRLIFQEITNDVARLTAFRNGQIDLFGAQPEQYRDMLNDQKLLDRTQQFEYQNPIGGYRYVAWNEQRNGKPTMFADKRVRQAMTLLTDRQTLINDVMLGYAQQATGPFNPTSKQYDTSVKPWPYDPARAKELLAEAGWQDRNKDGVLENEQGEKFIFKLTYPSGTSNYERMVLMLKDGYSRAGIAMELDPLEWAVFTERIEKKDFTAITLGWTAGIETDIFQMFHSSQAIPGGDNFMSYKSDKLDALIDEARSTIDEETRMPIWHEAHRIMHEDQPYTFLFFPKTLAFMDKRFEHVRVTNLGLNPRVEWYVPRDRQRWTKD